jgi:hypothetical protein
MVIAKIIPRKHGAGSFRDSVNYNLGLSRNDTDKLEYANTLNIFAPEVAAAEMEALALENTRSADPVFNCILSWRENEIPSRAQADEAVEITLRELGLEGCQTHYALHRNTENLHLHICVNRIDPETYKARDLAHGWTKKALEKAARKIELAQGWEIERSGRYAVTESGEILEKPREADGKVKLSQTARDIEAHTGEKSAERIGQETAAPIIREAKTWEELHQKLAEQGITFERKGSGAVLRVDKTVIKASQAGRDISMSKLEKRIGAYQERDVLNQEESILRHSGSVLKHTGEILNHPDTNVEAIERIEAEPKLKRSWEEYQKAKSEYLRAKKDAYSELREVQAKERESLIANHRGERTSLFHVSWVGKGFELNQRRSVMAAKQKIEKLDLRDRQEEEREKLRKRFPCQFPSFKKWISLDNDIELTASYRYPGQLVLFAGEYGANLAPAKNIDLRNYTPLLGSKRGGVMYCKNGKRVADFIDYGKRIVVSNSFDEAAVLAALQLASQKWSGINITGSEKYKRICAALAAKHGFKLVNPELQDAVAEAQRGGAAGIKPEAGQRVTFHPYNTQVTLTGEVLSIDGEKGTVRLLCGSKEISAFAAKGYFTPLEHAQTREYAFERAKKHAGKNGLVYNARSEGTYRGPIVETTPTFAIQKTARGMMTLHRLQDLEGFDEMFKDNPNVVIRKTAGKGTVCVEPQREERDRDTGWSR